MSKIKLYVPVGESAAATVRLAPRTRADLQGAVVGMVKNGWHSWADTLDEFDILLKGRYGVAATLQKSVPKTGCTELREAVYEELARKCDVVIVGFGQ